MGSPMWTPGNLPALKATIFLFNVISAAVAKRHIVYWNSTNTRLIGGDLSVQVNLNDYLDIYCPHYPEKGTVGDGQPETLALYLVGEAYFHGCVETRRAIKRWECNTPFAPFGPVRFSEKIQRFTPFSLGFEFLPGRHYYYSSLPTDEGPPLPCMKLRVTVCCEPSGPSGKNMIKDGCVAKVNIGVQRWKATASIMSSKRNASEGSKQIQETAPTRSTCSLRAASPPLILLLLLLIT